MLGAEAVAGGDVSKFGFVAAPLAALLVGLCKGNYLMHWGSLGVLITLDRVAGWASTREQIGLWRMYVTSGVLRGVCAFLC
jgi:hypothetical protein